MFSTYRNMLLHTILYIYLISSPYCAITAGNLQNSEVSLENPNSDPIAVAGVVPTDASITQAVTPSNEQTLSTNNTLEISPATSVGVITSTNKGVVTPNTTDVTETATNNNGTDTSPKLCEAIYDCAECGANNCQWMRCLDDIHSCSQMILELCTSAECADTTTVTPDTTPDTTSAVPTTTVTPITTKSTTSSPPTTSEATTIPPSTQPSSETPTSTASPAPHERHFDGASFIGGIIFATLLAGFALGGWMYYKKRILAHRYANF